MKTIILIIAVTLAFGFGAYGQSKKGKIKIYKIWVLKIDGSKEKGFFYKANEKGITVSKSKSLDASNLILVEAENISLIKVRRKGAIGKGAGIGFLSGAAVGAGMGFAQGDDEPGWFSLTKEDKAVGIGVALGLLGTGVGAIAGTGTKKIPIYGDLETYLTQLNSLINYDLIPN